MRAVCGPLSGPRPSSTPFSASSAPTAAPAAPQLLHRGPLPFPPPSQRSPEPPVPLTGLCPAQHGGPRAGQPGQAAAQQRQHGPRSPTRPHGRRHLAQARLPSAETGRTERTPRASMAVQDPGSLPVLVPVLVPDPSPSPNCPHPRPGPRPHLRLGFVPYLSLSSFRSRSPSCPCLGPIPMPVSVPPPS